MESHRAELQGFEALLRAKAVPQGMVAKADLGTLWDRHVVDSLRALPCLPDTPATILDVGSGAGLPGIPLAIARPDCRFTLIESRSRRAAFLELVVDELRLPNVRVVLARAETSGCTGKIAVTRALATADKAWQICRPLLEPEGFVVYFAGRGWPVRPAPALSKIEPRVEICGKPLFPWQGPIVKMTRSEERPQSS